ncbi:unnamed protein product, partial [Symbiodinium sp. CCMP2456]
ATLLLQPPRPPPWAPPLHASSGRLCDQSRLGWRSKLYQKPGHSAVARGSSGKHAAWKLSKGDRKKLEERMLQELRDRMAVGDLCCFRAAAESAAKVMHSGRKGRDPIARCGAFADVHLRTAPRTWRQLMNERDEVIATFASLSVELQQVDRALFRPGVSRIAPPESIVSPAGSSRAPSFGSLLEEHEESVGKERHDTSSPWGISFLVLRDIADDESSAEGTSLVVA